MDSLLSFSTDMFKKRASDRKELVMKTCRDDVASGVQLLAP